MEGRRAVRGARKAANPDAEATAHRAVNEVKQALGERGPAWWDDERIKTTLPAMDIRRRKPASRNARGWEDGR
jgi:hypothetical protein